MSCPKSPRTCHLNRGTIAKDRMQWKRFPSMKPSDLWQVYAPENNPFESSRDSPKSTVDCRSHSQEANSSLALHVNAPSHTMQANASTAEELIGTALYIDGTCEWRLSHHRSPGSRPRTTRIWHKPLHLRLMSAKGVTSLEP